MAINLKFMALEAGAVCFARGEAVVRIARRVEMRNVAFILD